MPKKALLIVISIVSILVIAGGVTGALLLAKVARPSDTAVQPVTTAPVEDTGENEDPSKQDPNVKPDLSVDLGACTLIPQASVQAAVGNKITVAAADNRGYSKEFGGDGTQLCVYSFVTDGSLNNRFTTRVTKFPDEKSKTAAITDLEDVISVSGLGDTAFFSSSSEPASGKTPARNDYSLYIFKDLNFYSLSIAQPGDKDLYTANTAQAVLQTIAQSAKF